VSPSSPLPRRGSGRLGRSVPGGRPPGRRGRSPALERGHPAHQSQALRPLAGLAPKTLESALIGLKCVLQRMAPEEDWAWLKRLTSRAKSWVTSSRVPCRPDLTPPEMLGIALAELERLSRIAVLTAQEHRLTRDSLLVALLLACPVRLRNLTMPEVDRHLVRLGPEWHLGFEPDETKTGQALHLIVPTALTPFLKTYLARAEGPAHGGGDDLRQRHGHERATLRHCA